MLCTELDDFLQEPHLHTSIDLCWSIDDEEFIAIAKTLATNKSVTHINLHLNNIDAANATALAKALETNNSVTHIDLSGSNIDAAGATALAKALETNKSVTHINLNSNNIGDAGTTALAKALETNNSVTHIDLFCKNIGVVGHTVLAEALEINHSVIDIHLDWDDMGYKEFTIINKLLERNKKIFSDISYMLKTLVATGSKEEKVTKLKDYASGDNAALLREFLKRPGAFKESLKKCKFYSDKGLHEIHGLILNNYLPMHAVAKNIFQQESAFKALSSDLMGHIAGFLKPGDINLTQDSAVQEPSDSAHASLIGADATHEHKDCGNCCIIT